MTYGELLEQFWQSHRADRASYRRQYMAAVFCETPEQLELARASRVPAAARLGREVTTEVVSGARFYPAEDYHQKYYLRHRAELMRELAHDSSEQLVASTVAARLNGFAAGHGSRADIASLGLSATTNAILQRLANHAG